MASNPWRVGKTKSEDSDAVSNPDASSVQLVTSVSATVVPDTSALRGVVWGGGEGGGCGSGEGGGCGSGEGGAPWSVLLLMMFSMQSTCRGSG